MRCQPSQLQSNVRLEQSTRAGAREPRRDPRRGAAALARARGYGATTMVEYRRRGGRVGRDGLQGVRQQGGPVAIAVRRRGRRRRRRIDARRQIANCSIGCGPNPEPNRSCACTARLLGRDAVRLEPVQRVAGKPAASDAAAAEVYEQIRNERLAGMTGFAEFLGGAVNYRAGVSVDEGSRRVVDVQLGRALGTARVRNAGWDTERDGRWIGDTLVATLLDPASRPTCSPATRCSCHPRSSS